MQKFLDIFMNIVIILMVIFIIYLGVDKFVLSNKENTDIKSEISSFKGEYVTEYYDINFSHYIVQKYLTALSEENIDILNSYLDNNLKLKDISGDITSKNIDNLYIQEVRKNDETNEFLITYYIDKEKVNSNTMLCKLNKDDYTFFIYYDSILNSK